MKTFVRLIRRYVLAAVGIVLLLVFLGLGLLVFLGWQETTHLPQRTYASSEIADAMVETPAGLALGAAHTPEEWMDGYAWAMYTVSFATLSVSSVATATCPASATAHR